MSAKSEATLRGVPTKPYDLLREGLIVLTVVAVVIVALAAALGSPDYPAVTAREVARKEPVAFLERVAGYLAGTSGLQSYGPPYTSDRQSAQKVLGLAPANLLGVTIPIDARKDFVLEPLAELAVLDSAIGPALGTFRSATGDQQTAWASHYLHALDSARVVGQSVVLPAGDYGPVPVLMDGMLDMARAGFMEGALNSPRSEPYALDDTRALLFLQGDIEDQVAGKLDMQGGQWGISHETGNYPGAWWLWPYTFLYQVPAIANSPNADALVGAILGAIFLLLVFLPVIPGVNRLPRALRVYRVIWRDWYRDRGAP
jgi:hypothetical protein